MGVWLINLLMVIIMVMLLFHLKIYMELLYKRQSTDDCLSVLVYVYKKIVVFRMDIPLLKVQADHGNWFNSVTNTKYESDKNSIKNAQQFGKLTKTYVRYLSLYQMTMNHLISFLHCEKFYLKTIFGTEDAAETGSVAGIIWILQGLLLQRLNRKLILNTVPELLVLPTFGCNRLEINFQCIFTIKLGNVICIVKNCILQRA